jgi:hypothetical protein
MAAGPCARWFETHVGGAKSAVDMLLTMREMGMAAKSSKQPPK